MENHHLAEECLSLQAYERETLQAIYPDFVAGSLTSLTLTILIELPQSCKLGANKEDDRDDTASPRCLEIEVIALPPVILDIHLPNGYPLSSPPSIKRIHVSHGWMSDTSKMSEALLQMWTPGNPVLCNWVEWIFSTAFLDDLHVKSRTGIEGAIHVEHENIIPLLREYDAYFQEAKFKVTSFTCSICTSSKKGTACISLNCGHVFCRDCLNSLWKASIADGDIERIGCPDPQCLQDEKEVAEEDIKKVVQSDVFKRWRDLYDKRTFNASIAPTYCPLAYCQAPVTYVPRDDPDPVWILFRLCGNCGYSFCSYCLQSWHGIGNECPRKAAEIFIAEALQRQNVPEELMHIAQDQAFSRDELYRIYEDYQQQQASKKLLEHISRRCPGCNLPVTLDDASNRCSYVLCPNCEQSWCFRCRDTIDPTSNTLSHLTLIEKMRMPSSLCCGVQN